MSMRWLVIIGVVTTVLAACGKTAQGPTKEEVRKVVQEFVVAKKNITLDNLRLEVGSVEVKGDEAKAEVIFAQTTEPKLAMSYTYTLKRAEKGWVVAASIPVVRQPEEGHGFQASPGPASGQPPVPAPAGPGKP